MEYGIATFSGANDVAGTITIKKTKTGVRINVSFSKLPSGSHGFHIHKGGDLSGEGCLGACEHYHKGPPKDHGGPTGINRHTGDLGNISGTPFIKSYTLKDVSLSDLYGRSFIVHEDADDLGKGTFEDSKTTGHSGKRIACAVVGRSFKKQTRKN